MLVPIEDPNAIRLQESSNSPVKVQRSLSASSEEEGEVDTVQEMQAPQKRHFQMIRMKTLIQNQEKEEQHRKLVERNTRKHKKAKELEQKMKEQEENPRLKNQRIKSEEQLKQEVQFASVEEMKLNPDNLKILADEVKKADGFQAKLTMEKQLSDFKKYQASYSAVTQKAAEKINNANASNRHLGDIQRNQSKFIQSLVLRDYHIVQKDVRGKKRKDLNSSPLSPSPVNKKKSKV